MLTCELNYKNKSDHYGSYMQLTLNDMRNLNRLLDKNYNKFSEELDLKAILKNIQESRIT